MNTYKPKIPYYVFKHKTQKSRNNLQIRTGPSYMDSCNEDKSYLSDTTNAYSININMQGNIQSSMISPIGYIQRL